MKQTILLTTLAAALSMADIANAEQNGSGHYMSGQQADFSTMVPTAPGWVFGNFFMCYNDGNLGGSKTIPFGRIDVTGKVTANMYGEVPAVIYTYPFDFFGGKLASAVLFPYVWVDVKASGSITR